MTTVFMKDVIIRGKWVKALRELSLLFLQIFYKSKIISKQNLTKAKQTNKKLGLSCVCLVFSVFLTSSLPSTFLFPVNVTGEEEQMD